VSEAFKPLGERSRWRMIYELFQKAKIGETVTYEQIGEALGLHPKRHRHEMQMAARRASVELARVDRHEVDAVRNVGYRVVEHREILGMARRRNRRAGNQLVRGQVTAQAVDLNQVDEEMRKGLETLARGLAAQSEINRAVGARLKRHEQIMNGLGGRLETLEERLRRLEGGK